jgi:glucose dehydrogenase
MLDAVTHLVLGNTLAVSALELVNLFTCEVLTELRTLICAVTAIIDFIAKIRMSHTEVVFALVLIIRAVFSVGESWLAIQLVRHIVAVLVAVALQLLLDAVARGTLEPLWRARVLLALVLIRPVATIIVVVTAPSSRNAFVIAALELRFRALPVSS